MRGRNYSGLEMIVTMRRVWVEVAVLERGERWLHRR